MHSRCYAVLTMTVIRWYVVSGHVPLESPDDKSCPAKSDLHSNVSLACTAVGHPNPQPKNPGCASDTIRQNTFEGIQRFICMVASDIETPPVTNRVALSVNFPRKMKVPRRLRGAALNANHILDCTVDESPRAIKFWFRNRQKILDRSTEERNSVNRKGSIGFYTCVCSGPLNELNEWYEFEREPITIVNSCAASLPSSSVGTIAIAEYFICFKND